ncbi:hypothetical protein, partial [Serratia marcescens]|uniref:hypothetical protein n=1 Tax=Serratia marcescens TaxID=615 RepID=UPI0013DBAC6A
LYGNKGSVVDLTLRIMANASPYPYYIDKAERSAVVVRVATVSADPEFHAFLVSQCQQRDLPTMTDVIQDSDVTESSRATEHLYRLLGIHSRR